MQRFGSALNINLHFHVIFLEEVYLDRTDQGRKPRFVTAEPPSDADMTAVVRRSVGASSARCGDSATWRRARRMWWPRGMIPCVMTPPSWPRP
jgi:hypothetical protein